MSLDQRVRYIGPGAPGIDPGRIGTVLGAVSQDITTVRWDLAPNCECQVTHSSVPAEHLEGILQLPKCPWPESPGTYVCKRGPSRRFRPELVQVVRDITALRYVSGLRSGPLEDIEDSAIWWGPFECEV